MYKVSFILPNAPAMPKGYAAYKAWLAEFGRKIMHTDHDQAIAACREAFYTGAEATQVFGPRGVEFSIYANTKGTITEQERIDHAPEMLCNECGARVEMNHTGRCPQCKTAGMFQVYTSRMINREIVNV